MDVDKNNNIHDEAQSIFFYRHIELIIKLLGILDFEILKNIFFFVHFVVIIQHDKEYLSFSADKVYANVLACEIIFSSYL